MALCKSEHKLESHAEEMNKPLEKAGIKRLNAMI